jgi:HK97 gp10 family phage protein
MEIGQFDQTVIEDLGQHPQVMKKVRAVAEAIRDEARRLAPVGTGELRRSIVIEDEPNSGELRVGWYKIAGAHGPFVEFGTEDTPAQPHLRPAADLYRNRGRP